MEMSDDTDKEVLRLAEYLESIELFKPKDQSDANSQVDDDDEERRKLSILKFRPNGERCAGSATRAN